MVLRILDDKSKIAWTPRKDGGVYAFAGKASLDRLLSGVVVTQGMASLMPASWNQIAYWLQQTDASGSRGVNPCRAPRKPVQ